jgi:hypothetical protein
MHHFQPHSSERRPCWHCSRFIGLIYQGSAAACELGTVRAMPAQGCAFWQREVGADDEPDQQPAPIAWPARNRGSLYSFSARPSRASVAQRRRDST